METMMDWLPTVGYAAIGALTFWLGPRAFTLVRAVTSGWNKDNVKARLAICKVCPRVKQRDYVDPEGGMTSFLYCDECKCGSHHIAELNTKLGFNHLKCPMDKWGPKSGTTVHEAHDMLVERGKRERAVDKRERDNIMAGRDRDYVGPLNAVQSGPAQLGDNGQPGNRTAQAQTQLQPTAEAAEAQRNKIQKAREARIEQQRKNHEARLARQGDQTNKIWGDREATSTATATVPEDLIIKAAPLAGVDHEGQILVDQKKEQSDGGHSLD